MSTSTNKPEEFERGMEVFDFDFDLDADYIISGEDVQRLRKIVDELKTAWPEIADAVEEIMGNLVEI